MRLRPLLAALAAAYCNAAGAADEHPRRLAAELVVMAGDVRRLALREGGPREREGLLRRVDGALSSLPLLLRRAEADADAGPVAGLRVAAARRDWPALAAALAALKRRHPFDAGGLLAAATPAAAALGKSIHDSICAGCHDAPATDSLLPPKRLGQQLAGMPPEEFAARLLLGVRGDKAMAYANPFSDAELAALIAWYGRASTGGRAAAVHGRSGASE